MMDNDRVPCIYKLASGSIAAPLDGTIECRLKLGRLDTNRDPYVEITGFTAAADAEIELFLMVKNPTWNALITNGPV